MTAVCGSRGACGEQKFMRDRALSSVRGRGSHCWVPRVDSPLASQAFCAGVRQVVETAVKEVGGGKENGRCRLVLY